MEILEQSFEILLYPKIIKSNLSQCINPLSIPGTRQKLQGVASPAHARSASQLSGDGQGTVEGEAKGQTPIKSPNLKRMKTQLDEERVSQYVEAQLEAAESPRAPLMDISVNEIDRRTPSPKNLTQTFEDAAGKTNVSCQL